MKAGQRMLGHTSAKVTLEIAPCVFTVPSGELRYRADTEECSFLPCVW